MPKLQKSLSTAQNSFSVKQSPFCLEEMAVTAFDCEQMPLTKADALTLLQSIYFLRPTDHPK